MFCLGTDFLMIFQHFISLKNYYQSISSLSNSIYFAVVSDTISSTVYSYCSFTVYIGAIRKIEKVRIL